MTKINHWINNQIFTSQSGRAQDVWDPATGQSEKQVVLADETDVNKAVEAAQTAFPAWANFSPLKRARILDKFKTLLWDNVDALAKVISAEHGKTHDDALGEITRGIEVVEFSTAIPHLLKSDYSDQVGTNVDSYNMRQSLGVVVGITPFNFPAMVPMWMFPIAIACGNTFVLKPSERDPSTSMMIADLLKQAGLPDGVFNIVHGDKVAVDALLTHPDVQAVSFVGSTPIAKYIYETGMQNGKRVQALGGAKNHMIIMPDADIDMAVNALIGASYGSAGERCMAISVAVPVTDAVADALIERLKPKVEALKIGPASDKATEMGPLITAQHRDKVSSYIDIGEQEGATLVLDGRGFQQKMQGYENGYYLGGTLFDNVTEEMRIWKEEIFGPVLSVVRKPDYQSAVKLVNQHQYANGTAIFTRDGDTARNFARHIQVGMVGVNVPIPVPMAFHSFGGWKGSLFGDHAMHGNEGVRFYTKIKTVTTRWMSGLREDPQFTLPTL
ncbi:MAG: CoA-acylating methylmalonate-semialdehyde dehydrogenase [Alphaproteobacteria bacterium]|nr:CoA-acylating methylmalonate-semialdehyde dehydrogenase [Alphaproteobacteria bacterium]